MGVNFKLYVMICQKFKHGEVTEERWEELEDLDMSDSNNITMITDGYSGDFRVGLVLFESNDGRNEHLEVDYTLKLPPSGFNEVKYALDGLGLKYDNVNIEVFINYT